MFTDPRGLGALVTELVGLPRFPVRLSSQAPGRSISQYLTRRRRGVPENRIAQDILTLPPSIEQYRAGRSRRALRTNLRAAAAEGFRCCPVDGTEVNRTLQAWLEQRNPSIPPSRLRETHLASPLTVIDGWMTNELLTPTLPAEWFVAKDAAGATVGIGAVCIDTDIALLFCLISPPHLPRWLLHMHIVERLYSSGIHTVCTYGPNALLLPHHVQYFQRLLGYRVAHLSVIDSGG